MTATRSGDDVAMASADFVGEDRLVRLRDGRALGIQVANARGTKPVLMFPGTPGSRVLPPSVPAIAEELDVQVIGIDRPGFGLSDVLPGRTILDWPADVAELADELGLERFAVLGISAATPYALACCLKLPGRVTKAVLAAPVTPLDRPVLRGRLNAHRATRPLLWGVRHSRLVARAFYALPAHGLRNAPERALGALARSLAPPDQRVLADPDTSSFLMVAMREGLRNGGRAWAQEEALVDADWGFTPSSLPVEVPVEVWYGEQDATIPPDHARWLVDELPNAVLRAYDGDAHFSVSLLHLDEILRSTAEQTPSGA